VQLDKNHSEAWTNLGILYESVNQPHDAMACFTNAGRQKAVPPNLAQRIKCLKSQLAAIPAAAAAGAKQKQLPSVEEAWNGQVKCNNIQWSLLMFSLKCNELINGL